MYTLLHYDINIESVWSGSACNTSAKDLRVDVSVLAGLVPEGVRVILVVS